MKNNVREYDKLKLFRNKRRNSELLLLAETQQDFDYRKLLIEENEINLHVFFSRMIVANYLSWFLLAASIYFIPFLVLPLAIVLRVFSYKSKKNFEKTYKSYQTVLSAVNLIIKREYGIQLT
jgi:hypothetical protein